MQIAQKILVTLMAMGLLFTFEGCTSCNSKNKPETNVTTENNTGIEQNNTTPVTVTQTSLKLSIDKTSLNKDENTTVKVMVNHSDGSSREVTSQVEWIVSMNHTLKVTDNTLKSLDDINTTLQAKLGSEVSNVVALELYWEVLGHRLPPRPDKTLNDSTLLGIDVNHNNVRDDVERWIYGTYKDKHPIHVDIGMQAARGYKLVLETPERAKEIRLKVDAALFCNWYYWKDAKEFNEPLLVKERMDTPVSSKYFNTKERKDIYLQYDKLLSGGVYDSPWADEMKSFCDFNISKYGE